MQAIGYHHCTCWSQYMKNLQRSNKGLLSNRQKFRIATCKSGVELHDQIRYNLLIGGGRWVPEMISIVKWIVGWHWIGNPFINVKERKDLIKKLLSPEERTFLTLLWAEFARSKSWVVYFMCIWVMWKESEAFESL